MMLRRLLAQASRAKILTVQKLSLWASPPDFSEGGAFSVALSQSSYVRCHPAGVARLVCYHNRISFPRSVIAPVFPADWVYLSIPDYCRYS